MGHEVATKTEQLESYIETRWPGREEIRQPLLAALEWSEERAQWKSDKMHGFVSPSLLVFKYSHLEYFITVAHT